MEVKINVLSIIVDVENKSKLLTRAMARQFPIDSSGERAFAADTGRPRPDAICKVRGEVLGKEYVEWLLLVEDPVAGLKWQPAVVWNEQYAKTMMERGYRQDDLAAIPTIVLL